MAYSLAFITGQQIHRYSFILMTIIDQFELYLTNFLNDLIYHYEKTQNFMF